MTNFEKYKEDLIKIEEGLAVDKKTKKNSRLLISLL